MDKSAIFQAVAVNEAGWQATVNEAWNCLIYDDKLRIRVLSQGWDSVEPVEGFVVEDGTGFGYYAEDPTFEWAMSPGGSGSAADTITVTAGNANVTTDNGNFFWPVFPGGSGSAPGTITNNAGNAEFTAVDTNHYFYPVFPK